MKLSQLELDNLNKLFKKLETDALTIANLPENKYLCIRLDGFKANKQYLKDVLINEDFNDSLYKSYKHLFDSFKQYFTKEYTSSIVCSFIINDEVSIILNKDNVNDGKRIMKICTLFSGVLSSNMTRNLKNNETIFFDARPLILSRNEISKYIRYRYLISKRYSYWKVLRLNNFHGVFDDRIKKNLDNSILGVKEIGKESDVEKIVSTMRLFLTEKEIDPSYSNIAVNEKNMSINNIEMVINNYLNYLHSKKQCNKIEF